DSSIASKTLILYLQNFKEYSPICTEINYYDKVKELAKKTNHSINIQNHMKRTSLHYAVITNHEEIVKFILELGADTNMRDSYGNTPLYYAVKNNNYNIVNLL